MNLCGGKQNRNKKRKGIPGPWAELLVSRPTSPHSAKPNPHGHCHAEPAPQPLCLARSSDVWARLVIPLPPFERNVVTNHPSPPGSEQQGFGERPRTSGYKWEATQLFRLSIVHRAPSRVEGETERDGEVRCAAAIMGGCLHHSLGPSVGRAPPPPPRPPPPRAAPPPTRPMLADVSTAPPGGLGHLLRPNRSPENQTHRGSSYARGQCHPCR
jgi:hypothetical protein